jgi:hypothetical protein
MTKTRKLLATGIGAVMALSLGGAAAIASSSTTVTKTGPESTAAADTDTVQGGDQTGPEVADATEEPSGASSETEGSSETGPSDGPGGHEDPAGTVDHQFEGNE